MSEKYFDGSFFDADYYERGQESGKGWLQNYHWMPRRSFREAFAFIEYLDLNDDSYILDIGCAKGFLVRAFRELEIKADGCDISEYALSFTPEGCWNCSEDSSWEERKNFGYTHVVIKDTLEHLNESQLKKILFNISLVTNNMMCVVPMGDSGKYRIEEYSIEISHLIAEDEAWWRNLFVNNGWEVVKHCPHVPGLKDNWQHKADGLGNHVYVLKKV